ALFLEGLRCARRTGDRWLISELVYHLGILASARGDPASAIGLLKEALEIQSELCDQSGVGTTLYYLAHSYLEQGDAASAETLFRQSLRIGVEFGRILGTAAACNGLAALAVRRGQVERA